MTDRKTDRQTDRCVDSEIGRQVNTDRQSDKHVPTETTLTMYLCIVRESNHSEALVMDTHKQTAITSIKTRCIYNCTNSFKWPAPVTDTFSASRGCLLTRA